MPEFIPVIPGQVPQRELFVQLLSAVAPRPIAFASTIDKEGNPNLSPFSFFNIFGSNPPVLIFSPARRGRDNTTKDTYHNVMDHPEVVINIVNHAIVEQMNLASTEFEKGVNEFVKAGFTAIPSDIVKPFRVAESPVQLECKVTEIKPTSLGGGAGNLIICEVLKMHISKEVVGDDGVIDPDKIDLVARMGKNYYCRASGAALFEVAKPVAATAIGFDGMPESVRLSTVLTGNELGILGSIEELPSAETIGEFYKQNKGIVDACSSAEDLHEKAREYLKKGDKESAWKVLLCRKT